LEWFKSELGGSGWCDKRIWLKGRYY
jgi:hypothetical protein